MSTTGLWIRKLLSLTRAIVAFARSAFPSSRSGFRQAKCTKETTKEIHTLANDDSLPFALDDLESESHYHSRYRFDICPISLPSENTAAGSLIIPDPYETYLKSLPNGQNTGHANSR